MDHVTFLGVPIDALTRLEARDRCVALARRTAGPTASFIFVNPHTLVRARAERPVMEAVLASDLRLADGAGLMLVGRMRGTSPPERIPAPDFVPELSAAFEATGGARYFFYGSDDHVLHAIRTTITERWPHIAVVGTLAPPFREMSDTEEAEHVAAINAARPDVLWVGMTAPKQELWVHRNRHRLTVPLVGCVGAAFDFLAGTKRRSPAWARRLGFEWLDRLVREPSRLWERTMISAPLFLWYSALESLGLRSGPGRT